MDCKRRQSGFISVMAVTIIITLMTLFAYGLKYLEYKKALSRYSAVAHDMLIVAKVWEEAMNYQCVANSVPTSLSLSDLQLPRSLSGDNYNHFSFSYQSPPLMSMTLMVTLTEKGARVVERMVETKLKQYQFGSDVSLTINDATVALEVRRMTETSKMIADRTRYNSVAQQTSLWLGGTSVYDSNGCQ
ncbi:hypothetical protein AB9X29_003768 [Vibrio vulnificus]